MKKITSIFVVFILLASCKKESFNDALPAVVIQSIVPYGFDSVIVTGKITTAGAGNLDYVGFCYGSGSINPGITLNQVLLNGTSGSFSAALLAYQDSSYSFKAFAANDLGYSFSSVVKYTVPHATAVIAPCTLINNQITDAGSTFGVAASGSASNPSYGNYMVTINGTNEDIYISFANLPQNGIYITTTNGSSLAANQVIINISNFNQYTINGGQKVYVALNKNATTTISFCSLTYNNGVSNATMFGETSY